MRGEAARAALLADIEGGLRIEGMAMLLEDFCRKRSNCPFVHVPT
jgi:hypothetical protein